VKESSFYVELLEVPVEVSCEVEDDAEGLYSGRGCDGFVVIDAELLSIAFCDIPDFVTGDVASVISFPPADKFSLQGTFSGWEFRAGGEDEDFHVFKAAEFLLRAGNPVFLLWGCEGFSPQGVVI
jgi:hypothetical protein